MPPFKAYVSEAGTCAQNPLTHRPFLPQTLEVRCPQPMKAKWVRVELRKIENLPGGAQFVDHVGQSPLTVWQPQEGEWGVLHSVSPVPYTSYSVWLTTSPHGPPIPARFRVQHANSRISPANNRAREQVWHPLRTYRDRLYQGQEVCLFLLTGLTATRGPPVGRLCRRSDTTCLSSRLAFRAGSKLPVFGLRCRGK